MGYWKRHPRKELEQLLTEFDRHGWRIERGKGYYQVYCPCPQKHKRGVHLTPSGARYVLNEKVVSADVVLEGREK